MAAFLTPFTGSSINIALPLIQEEFSVNAIVLGWVSASFLLTAAMFLVPFGRIADICGRKRVFLYGIAIFTLFSLLCALSTSSFMLITSRLFQGVGGAMIFGTGVAILTSVFPPKERGRALGINVAAVYTGLSLGPFFGGVLCHYFGWRSIFMVNVPMGIAVILMILWKLKGEWAEARGEKFDFAGAFVYALALPAIMYGFSELPGTTGFLLIVVGILGLAAFVMWEARVNNPVLNVNLFRKNTVFALSNLAALINYSATFAVGFLLSLYLQYVKGFDTQHAGYILASQPVVMAVFSPSAGKLSDRMEPRLVASAGMAMATAGLFLLAFLYENTPVWFVVLVLVLLGLGFALFSSPNTNAVMSSVEKRYYGVASGTLGTMRLTGQMLSMGIAMLVFAVYMGDVKITARYYPAFLTSVRVAFIIFAGLCFGGIFASLARGKVH
ncbi:MAG: MFS transporter [Bacillota bacterium]